MLQSKYIMDSRLLDIFGASLYHIRFRVKIYLFCKLLVHITDCFWSHIVNNYTKCGIFPKNIPYPKPFII